MVAKILSSTIVGLDARPVLVEVDAANGLPATVIVGLPGTAVQESRERVRAAIRNSGFQYPLAKISVNLAPAHLPKLGTRFDLPIAVGILLAGRQVTLPTNKKLLIIGELSLDGAVRPVSGVVATVMAAKFHRCDEVYVPAANFAEACLVEGITVYPVSSLVELVSHFSGKIIRRPAGHKMRAAAPLATQIDLLDIAGQETAKRALTIAAAGHHNIAMVGPPGAGKTMLARALPGLMPDLSRGESLEVAKIYSAVGRYHGVSAERPFRAPHHTATYRAMLGGGSVPMPGEVTLAHRGVLFLDELPEFSRAVLEALRQPLEERQIILTRGDYTVRFPASCLLVAAYNPCPCGFLEDGSGRCQCPARLVQMYKRKLSGPLLDRIDLQLGVARANFKEMAKAVMEPEEVQGAGEQQSSAVVRTQVELARGRQTRRLGPGRTNSDMSPAEVKKFCAVKEGSGRLLLQQAAARFNLSNRGLLRVLKVARTIADLAGSKTVQDDHIAEALHYRVGLLE